MVDRNNRNLEQVIADEFAGRRYILRHCHKDERTCSPMLSHLLVASHSVFLQRRPHPLHQALPRHRAGCESAPQTHSPPKQRQDLETHALSLSQMVLRFKHEPTPSLSSRRSVPVRVQVPVVDLNQARNTSKSTSRRPSSAWGRRHDHVRVPCERWRSSQSRSLGRFAVDELGLIARPLVC